MIMVACHGSAKWLLSILLLLHCRCADGVGLAASSQFQMIASPTSEPLNAAELEQITQETASQLLSWQNQDASIDAVDKYVNMKIVFEEALFNEELALTNIRFFALATSSYMIEGEDARLQQKRELDQVITGAFSDQDFKDDLVLSIQMLSSEDMPQLQEIRSIAAFIIAASLAPSAAPVAAAEDGPNLSVLDILLILVSSFIFIGILYMVIQHHIDQGYFENQRLRAANAPISHSQESDGFSAVAVRSEPNRMNYPDPVSPKDESETPSTPSTIESVMREEDPDFMMQAVSTPKRKIVSSGKDIKSFMSSVPVESSIGQRESNVIQTHTMSNTTYIYREETPSFIRPEAESLPHSLHVGTFLHSAGGLMNNQQAEEDRLLLPDRPSSYSKITTEYIEAVSSNPSDKELAVIEEEVEIDDNIASMDFPVTPAPNDHIEGTQNIETSPLLPVIESDRNLQILESSMVDRAPDLVSSTDQTALLSTAGDLEAASSPMSDQRTFISTTADIEDASSLFSEVETESVVIAGTVLYQKGGEAVKSSMQKDQFLVETVTSLSSEEVEPALNILAESFDSEWFHEEIKKAYAKDRSLSRYTNNDDGSVKSSTSSEDIFGVDVDASVSAAGNSVKSKASTSSAIAEWMKSIQVKGRASTGSKTSAMSRSASLSHEPHSSSVPDDSSVSISSDSSSSMYDSSSSDLSSLDRLSVEQSMASSVVGGGSSLTTSSTFNSNISKQSKKSKQSPTRKISRRRLPPSTPPSASTNGIAEV